MNDDIVVTETLSQTVERQAKEIERLIVQRDLGNAAIREAEEAKKENQKLWGWYETELKRSGALQSTLNKAETEIERLEMLVGYGNAVIREAEEWRKEVERLRLENNHLKQTAQGRVSAALHEAALREKDEEIEHLRQQVTQRGARMQIMWDWMAETFRLDEFYRDNPEAADWFDADGVPK